MLLHAFTQPSKTLGCHHRNRQKTIKEAESSRRGEEVAWCGESARAVVAAEVAELGSFVKVTENLFRLQQTHEHGAQR